MKTYIFKLMATMALLIAAIPMHSQNYLKIWFKDGHTERHFMHLVQNISTTKYDLEGNLHSDYQMQQIVMPDTTYSYYLADIDSMSFRKVDDQNVKKDVINVITSISPIFQQSQTAKEMIEHLNEVHKIESVDSIWSIGNDVIVQVRDWRKIFYHFHDFDDENISLNRMKKSLAKNLARNKSAVISNNKKVAVAVQMINDTRFNDDISENRSICDEFNSLGFKAEFITDSKLLDYDFFINDLYTYDIVFLDTHGSFDGDKHWLMTSMEIDPNDTDSFFQKYESFDIDFVSWCQQPEYTNNQCTYKWYVMLPEDIKTKKFDKSSPKIIFNEACQSLKGTEGQEILRNLTGISEPLPGNSSMARTFFDKGANVYFGYNESQGVSGYAAHYLFNEMLQGRSIESALFELSTNYPSKLIDYKKYDGETLLYTASLINLYNPEIDSDIVQSTFLVKTFTKELTQQEIDSQFSISNSVLISGYTSMLNLEESSIRCGFRYGHDPTLLISYKEQFCDNLEYCVNENGNISFSCLISDIEPGQTYFYRAFTYDGMHYNYGKTYPFKINKIINLELSNNSLSLNVGQSTTVDITSGSGSYSIESIYPEGVVTASIVNNSSVAIEAHTAGTAVITVKDNISEQTQTITVTVTGQTDSRELLFSKTVGSAVYSMYKKVLSESDYHINPDGWKCYRSELSLDITKGGKTNSFVVDKNIYLDKVNDHHGGQQPCMLLDFNTNMIYIFCNSKDDGPYYSMDGNFYSSSMNNIHFSKETVFEGANWGWYPYFCDYGDDNIYLCNFSFAGYFTIMAVREGNTWELYYYNTDISPEQATREWEIAGPVLVIGNPEEEVDERIPTVIPDEIRDEIEQYIPIYDGVDPPNIEGAYYLSPEILIGSSRSNDQIGKEYDSEYQNYSNQDMVKNTIDMVRVQGGGNEWHKGSGAFISGSGNNFTIYFDQVGESSGILVKQAYIVSGTKTSTGIKNLTTGFIMKEKGPDPNNKLVEVGTYRFFKDQDGMSEATTWPYGTQYNTKKRVKQANSLPNSLDR